MRLLIAHVLVILVSIPSLGAASRLNNSESNQAPKVNQKQALKPQPRSATSKTAATRHSGHRPYQIGKASWYGKHFHGRKTASGERYDMFQFTAAHKQLPLGTYVKVTNLRNGRWVVVKVNDRGPVPQSRIIDLSYGAAQMLDMRAHGVERVELDVVEPQTVAQLRSEQSEEESELAGLQ